MKYTVSAALALFGMAFLCVIVSTPVHKAHAEELDMANEFIFKVVLPPEWLIAEALFAYEKDGKYYLPINELGDGFDFLVETDLSAEYASGLGGSEANSFSIDGSRNELTIKGERETLPPGSILDSGLVATDDLYVQLEILNRIWPVDMALELSRLEIVVTAEQDLPFVAKKKREEKQDLVLSRKEARQEKAEQLPYRDTPYQYLGKPAIDYQAVYTYDDEKDDWTGSNIFSGVQQIGKMVAEYSANFALVDQKIQKPDNVRLKFSRTSAGEDYVLPGVRNIEFGDVNLRQRDLIGNTSSGRGIFVSNDNNDRFNEFDTITVEGTGPAGWDMELYNNDQLIDFAVVPDNGQFFFEDVILNFGSNQIKILFFGPQGQVREDTRTYTAGGNMLSPGRFVYNAGILDSDRSFILLDNDPRTTPRGVVKTGGVSYGLTNWLTVFGNYTALPERDKDYSYMTAGAAMSTPIGLMETELYNQINGGHAISTNLITSAFDTRINLGLAKFNDFESSDAGFDDNRKTFEATAQFNKNIKLFSMPLGLRLNTRHTERKTGDPLTAVDTAQTISRGGIRVSHNTTSRFNDFVHESTTAGITTTVREGQWQLRGNLNYKVHPKWEFDSVNTELRYRTDERFQAAVGVGYTFDTQAYRTFAQVGYEWDKVLGTFETRYERGEGWDFVLRATTSLNPYSPEGDYQFTGTQKRQMSPIQARVFLDKNTDGIFNEDDEPLEDVRLRIANGYSRENTNENGLLMVNAPANKMTNFSVDVATLKDPYLQPQADGFSTVPSRGNVIKADFAVVETGAVEGTVYRKDNDLIVAGLTVELFDENNEKIAETVSAFDGYYVFEFLKPGTYKIKAAPSHGVALGDNDFALNSDDLFIYGNDLYVDIGESAEQVAAVPAVAPIYGPYFDDVNPAAGDKDGHVEKDAQETLNGEAGEENALEGRAADDELNDATEKTVKDARFRAHKGKARLALDLSEDVEYEIIPQDDPDKIDIYIKQASWQPVPTQIVERDGKRYKYEVQRMEDGVILTLSSNEKIDLARNMSVPAEGKYAARLLFDVN